MVRQIQEVNRKGLEDLELYQIKNSLVKDQGQLMRDLFNGRMGLQNSSYVYSQTTDTKWRNRSKKSENLGQCGRQKYATLQMFTWNYRDSTVKSECRDFKSMGIACIPEIPVILKFHTLISIVIHICREFDFTGILRWFPALDVRKPCNSLIFWNIHAKFAGIICKL